MRYFVVQSSTFPIFGEKKIYNSLQYSPNSFVIVGTFSVKLVQKKYFYTTTIFHESIPNKKLFNSTPKFDKNELQKIFNYFILKYYLPQAPIKVVNLFL